MKCIDCAKYKSLFPVGSYCSLDIDESTGYIDEHEYITRNRCGNCNEYTPATPVQKYGLLFFMVGLTLLIPIGALVQGV